MEKFLTVTENSVQKYGSFAVKMSDALCLNLCELGPSTPAVIHQEFTTGNTVLYQSPALQAKKAVFVKRPDVALKIL